MVWGSSPTIGFAFVDQFVEWMRGQLSSSTSYGLVIGINSYDHTTDLNYAVNDANAMAKVLKELGFQVPPENVLVKEKPDDPPITKSDIRTAIRRVLKGAKSTDRVLVFYAGHGKEVPYHSGTEAYLLPSDYDPMDIVDSGLSFKDVVRWADLRSVRANQILFVLDACYAADALKLEGFRDENESPDALNKDYFKMLVSGRFVAGLTAGDQGQQVKEVNGHGVFTGLLTRGLLGEADVNGNGVIQFAELVTWLEPKVYQESKPHYQNVKIGRLPPGSGQMVFTVPADSARHKILGVREGKALSQTVRRRQAKLSRMRGETNTGAKTTGEGLRGEEDRMKELEEANRQLEARLRLLEQKGQGNPVEKAQEKMQLEARLRTLDQTRRLKQEMIGKDGVPMVLVPEGKFRMGTSEKAIEQWLRAHPEDKREWFEDEQPQHTVFLKDFYMDQYEVTTKRYQAFMNDSGRGEPKYWSRTIPVSQAEKPVVGVTWDDAQAYCEHYGKRLPTEAEWEKAARGTDGRIYPWGNEAPTSRHANFDSDGTRGFGDFNNYGALTAVGSRSAGASPYGVQDMAGNVWEWVADWYDETYYQNSQKDNPDGANVGKYRVLRGGSWDDDARSLRSSNRGGDQPASGDNYLGFRCARTAP